MAQKKKIDTELLNLTRQLRILNNTSAAASMTNEKSRQHLQSVLSTSTSSDIDRQEIDTLKHTFVSADSNSFFRDVSLVDNGQPSTSAAAAAKLNKQHFQLGRNKSSLSSTTVEPMFFIPNSNEVVGLMELRQNLTANYKNNDTVTVRKDLTTSNANKPNISQQENLQTMAAMPIYNLQPALRNFLKKTHKIDLKKYLECATQLANAPCIPLIVNDLQDKLRDVFPNAIAIPYGSRVTELSSSMCDLDINIELGKIYECDEMIVSMFRNGNIFVFR